MKSAVAACIVFLALAATACSQGAWLLQRGNPVAVKAYSVGLAPLGTSNFRVGVGESDITPPPGFPTGGHGAEGNLARGYWGRLYAHAFFFQDQQGRTLTLVSCDLFAMPRGLQAEIARRVSTTARTPRVWLPPEAIIIAATHTHQGPGNYMSAATYNGFGSFIPGFDKGLFEHLADRIAQAINTAIDDAQKPGTAALAVRVGRVEPKDAFQLNRSPATFFLNWNRQQTMNDLAARGPLSAAECAALKTDLDPDGGWELEGCPRLRAVDPAITLLQVQRADKTIGVLVFFAAHPTAMIHSAPFYSADFAGNAVTTIERTWPVPGEHPVVGFFNGAEGDVVTRRGRRDVTATKGIGDRFAESIMHVLHDGDVRTLALGPIKVGRSLIKPAEGRPCQIDDVNQPIELARIPVVGTAALGGGEGDRTALYDLGWKEGVRDVAKDGQGAKLPALDSQLLRLVKVTTLLAPPESFPMELPISYVDLSGIALVAFPAEISTQAGVDIRRQLGIAKGLGHGQLELIGLADDYTGYVASPSEYALQDYMGASTIWGPREGPYFACSALQARDKPGPLSTKVTKLVFWPGTPEADEMKFGPNLVGDRRAAPDEDLEQVLLDKNGDPQRELPYFEWASDSDSQTGNFGVAPRIAVVDSVSNARFELESDFLTLLEQRPDHGQEAWATYWLSPMWSAVAMGEKRYYFEVRPSPQTVVCSQPFSVNLDAHLPAAEKRADTCPSSK